MFNLGYKIVYKKSGQYVDVSSLPVTGQSRVFEKVLENEKGRFSVTFLVYGFGTNQRVRILKVVPLSSKSTDINLSLPIFQEKQTTNYRTPKTGYKEPAISHFSYIYLSSQMTRAPSRANFARFA